MGSSVLALDNVCSDVSVNPSNTPDIPRHPVDIRDNLSPQISPAERWFLDLYHAIGSVGVLVLKSLTYLTLKGRSETVQISRETLARHCGRSVRTVSRAVARLKARSLILVEQPPPQGFDCWTPNVYRLSALGIHVAALLGTGSIPVEPPARDTEDALVFSQSSSETFEEGTSGTAMSRAENSAAFIQPTEEPPPGDVVRKEQPPAEQPYLAPINIQPAPSLGLDLEPLVRNLEQSDSQRFTHLRDWLQAKLRAGIPRRHLTEALAALTANLAHVRSWAGFVQDRLEDLARAEYNAARARERTLASIQRFKQQVAQWEQERAVQPPSSITLSALVAAERVKARVTEGA